jgi:hypothetical protein
MEEITPIKGVLPPSIIPVVILRGTDYQMGYQYGQQAGQYIEMLKDATWAAIPKSLNRDDVLFTLKGLQSYVIKYTPEAIDQIKGIADGATSAGYEVSYTDVLLINCPMESLSGSLPPGTQSDELPPDGCSVFAAWGRSTTSGKLIFGDSKDSVFNHQVIIVAFPDKGNNYMTGVRAGELGEHFAMNNMGLFIGTGQNPSKLENYTCGIRKPFIIQHLLRFTNNATEAKSKFISWKFGKHTNFIFADVKGDAYVVERTATAKPVRKSGGYGETDFIYSTNNVMTDEMKKEVNGKKYIEHAGWKIDGNAIPRSLMIWNMLHNYQGNVDLDFVKMMWRFNDHPKPNSIKKEDYRIERDQKICRFENMRVTVGLPDNGDKGEAYICTGPAGRILHPPTHRKRDCFQIDGTHSFYKLTLASSPVEIVRLSKEDAHENLTNLYRELMFLKHTDPGYTLLNGIYSQATTEYYEGVIAYNKGRLANGNKALLFLSSAATALTKSQAHAKQAYNALVPPPTRPKDLGLKPYKGSWGKWASI